MKLRISYDQQASWGLILTVHHYIHYVIKKEANYKNLNFQKKTQTCRTTLVLLFIYLLLHFNMFMYVSKLYIFHFHVNFLTQNRHHRRSMAGEYLILPSARVNWSANSRFLGSRLPFWHGSHLSKYVTLVYERQLNVMVIIFIKYLENNGHPAASHAYGEIKSGCPDVWLTLPM